MVLWQLADNFNPFGCSHLIVAGVCVCVFFQGKLPVRWMALESLEDYSYTSESDV